MRKSRYPSRSIILYLCLVAFALSGLGCLESLPEVVFHVTIISKKKQIEVDEQITFKAAVIGVGKYDYTVTWSSLHDTIASVDPATGKVVGLQVGTTTITATSNGDDTKSASVKLTVLEKTEVTGISVTAPTTTIEVNEEVTLIADVDGTGEFNDSVTWRSLDKDVAEVDPDTGKVKGTGVGEVTIVAVSTTNVRVFGTITITVLEETRVTGIGVTPGARTIELGEEFTLTAEVSGTGRFDDSVTWSSSDETGNIVRLEPVMDRLGESRTCEVVGIGVGQATITATSDGDGTKSATSTIMVVKPKVVSLEIAGGDDSVSVPLNDVLQLTAVALDARGNTINDAELAWSIEETETGGVTINSDTGELASGNNEVEVTVIVRGRTEQEVTDRITVIVSEFPTLLELDFHHADTDVGLLYSRNGLLQSDLPGDERSLDVRVPANYLNLDLESCVVEFAVSDGATLTYDGAVLESGVSRVDFSEEVTFIVTRAGNARNYSISVSISDYGIIPDERFRTFLRSRLSDAFQGELLDTSHDEVTQLKEMDCSESGIESLEGIGFFTGLTKLECTVNRLEKVDISQNRLLSHLDVRTNNLTRLDVGQNSDLAFLSCSYNSLTELDVSRNLKLRILYIHSNNLGSISLTNNVELEAFLCSDNRLTELNVSSNIRLKSLHCSNNKLTELDLSDNTNLESLSCNRNQLRRIDMSGMSTPRSTGNGGLHHVSLYVEFEPTNNYETIIVSRAMGMIDELVATIRRYNLQGPTVSEDGDILTFSR